MEKIREMLSQFGEWNKKNWNAGGKDRWKVIGLWVVVLFIIGSIGEKGENQSPQQRRYYHNERILEETPLFPQQRRRYNTQREEDRISPEDRRYYNEQIRKEQAHISDIKREMQEQRRREDETRNSAYGNPYQ